MVLKNKKRPGDLRPWHSSQAASQRADLPGSSGGRHDRDGGTDI